MKTNTCLGVLLVIVAWAPPVVAQSNIAVSSDVAGNEMAKTLTLGEVIPVTFSVASDGEAGILAMDFRLSCASEALRLRAVTFNPAFSTVLGAEELSLPGARLHTVRVQPPFELDRALGSAGQPVWFARVELEVMDATAFELAVWVESRGTLVTGTPVGADVLGVAAGQKKAASGRITITNVPNPTPADGPTAGDEPLDPWTCTQAEAALEVQPIGGGAPVTVLAPYTTYEAHYAAGYDHLNFYTLFAVVTSAVQGFSAGAPPASGVWSATGNFDFVDVANELGDPAASVEFPAGYFRYQMLSDDLWSSPGVSAGAEGHLCNFTTAGAGELNLELYLCWLDESAHQTVDMTTQAQFTVLAGDTDGNGSSGAEE